MTRKATDVLLNIEEMLSKVLGHNRNQDLLIKTLVNKISVLESKLEKLGENRVAAPPQASSPNRVNVSNGVAEQSNFPQHSGDGPKKLINSQLPGLKPNVTIKRNQVASAAEESFDFKGFGQQNRPSQQNTVVKDPNVIDEDEKIELEKNHTGERRGSRYGSDVPVNRQVPVQQKITYPDDRGISVATVELFQNNQLFKTFKTNAHGKWTNAIPPGDYLLKVSKRPTATKPAVEAQTELFVPDSDEPVQLKPFKIG